MVSWFWTYWWHLTKHARRKWKAKLTSKGLRLGRDTRLTNLRHADVPHDGLRIFATSRGELVIMGEGGKNFPSLGCNWMAWKGRFGRPPPYKKQFILKYVGLWLLIFDIFCTATRHTNIWATISQAISLCVGGKFHQHKFLLLNKHLFLGLRLQFLHATVFPTLMFGFASLPLTAHKLDVAQQRMLTPMACSRWTFANQDAEGEPKNGPRRVVSNQ